jgi:hypothetical protein
MWSLRGNTYFIFHPNFFSLTPHQIRLQLKGIRVKDVCHIACLPSIPLTVDKLFTTTLTWQTFNLGLMGASSVVHPFKNWRMPLSACDERTVFFSKRGKNSSLCARRTAPWVIIFTRFPCGTPCLLHKPTPLAFFFLFFFWMIDEWLH